VLGSVISVYYYLRLPVVMYFGDASAAVASPQRREISTGEALVLVLCCAVVLLFGFFPSNAPGFLAGLRPLEWARSGVAMLF
jgi:NADH:ubiquinone oxidoreductase subunit 2 (subunit N)